MNGEESSVTKLIKKLQLIPHVEGGYFRETYRSGTEPMTSGGHTDLSGTVLFIEPDHKERNVLTSIYYLLTKEQPKNYWHRNKSNIVRYFQGGDSFKIYLISPKGQLFSTVLGLNVLDGEVPQKTIPAGYWEAIELQRGNIGWGLIGEAVAPGFDYRDLELGTDDLSTEYPHLKQVIRQFLKENQFD